MRTTSTDKKQPCNVQNYLYVSVLQSELKLTVTAGDLLMAQPVMWEAGTITVELPEEPIATGMSKRDALYHNAPEIEYTVSVQKDPPAAVFPIVTCALTLMPLILWLLTLPKLGINTLAWRKGSGSVVCALFVVGLAAMLVLAVYFWVYLTVVELALPLLGLSVALIVVGHQALSSLASDRLASTNKKM